MIHVEKQSQNKRPDINCTQIKYVQIYQIHQIKNMKQGMYILDWTLD